MAALSLAAICPEAVVFRPPAVLLEKICSALRRSGLEGTALLVGPTTAALEQFAGAAVLPELGVAAPSIRPLFELLRVGASPRLRSSLMAFPRTMCPEGFRVGYNGSPVFSNSLFFGAAASVVWFSGHKSDSQDHSSGTAGSGDQNVPPPPPPPGNGGEGFGGVEKALLIKLLLELQDLVSKSLRSNASVEELQACEILNKVFDANAGDLPKLKALLETVIKQLKENHGLQGVIKHLDSLSTDVKAVVQLLVPKKSPNMKRLEELVGEAAAVYVVSFFSAVGGVFNFCQGKVMYAFVTAACFSCEVYPKEACRLGMCLCREIIDDKRAKIKKLQDKVNGVVDEDELDAIKLLRVILLFFEEQGGKIKDALADQDRKMAGCASGAADLSPGRIDRMLNIVKSFFETQAGEGTEAGEEGTQGAGGEAGEGTLAGEEGTLAGEKGTQTGEGTQAAGGEAGEGTPAGEEGTRAAGGSSSGVQK